MNIKDQMRIASVKRWHTIDTLKEQTVAEHTFNVLLLYAEVCRRVDGANLEMLEVETILMHDAEEVFYGDVPSPAKYKTNWGELTETELVIKACDYLEAMIFIYQFGVGVTGDLAIKYMHAKCSESSRYMRDDVRFAFKGIWMDIFGEDLVL